MSRFLLLLCSVCGKIVFQPKSGVTFSGLVYFNTRNYFNTKMHTLQIIASAWELRFYVSRPRINCSISGKVTFLNVSSGIALREHSCSCCPCFAFANVPIRQTVSVFLSLSLASFNFFLSRAIQMRMSGSLLFQCFMLHFFICWYGFYSTLSFLLMHSKNRQLQTVHNFQPYKKICKRFASTKYSNVKEPTDEKL